MKTSNQTLKHHESNLSQKLHWEHRECISLMPGLLVHMKTFDPDRSPTLLKPWALYRCTYKVLGNQETIRRTLLLKYWFSLLPRHPARSVSKTIGDFGEVLQKSFYMETSALPISVTCRPFKRIDEKHCCLTRFENNWLT